MNKRTVRMVASLIMFTLLMSCATAQSYTTYAQSSNLGKTMIDKSSSVWIICDTTSFMWNRSIESSVMDQLSKRDISTLITTDYLDICGLEENELSKVTNLIMESDADYLLAIQMKDLYTYTTGGGIMSMNITATLLNLLSGENALIIELATEADTNDFKSLNATRKLALDSMAETLAKEFMKYAR